MIEIDSITCRYLTGSKNAVFSKYFVYDKKYCGDVSYSRQMNTTEAFWVEFGNVNKKDIYQIRPAFDELVQKYV